jgi:hypothetical protein
MFMILLGEYRVGDYPNCLEPNCLECTRQGPSEAQDPAKLSLREDLELVPLESIHAAAMARGMKDSVVSENIRLRRGPSVESSLGGISASTRALARRARAVGSGAFRSE